MQISVGDRMTYYPNQPVDKNRHPTAEVLAVGRLVRIKIIGGEPLGKVISVSARCLTRQADLLGVE